MVDVIHLEMYIQRLDNETMENILGKRMHEKRIARRLTQEKFGDLVGVSKWTVINWEGGKRIPLATYLPMISAVLNVPIDYLLGIESICRDINGSSEDFMENGIASIPVKSYNEIIDTDISTAEKMPTDRKFIFVDKASLRSDWKRGKTPFAVVANINGTAWGILKGSLVIVNPSEKLNNMDVALVCYHKKLSFKKIRFCINGSIDMISPEGHLLNVAAEEKEREIFRICGKAIFSL